MAYASNSTYTSPANLTGTDFSITLATKTHLAITFHVDTKMMMKRVMPALICVPVFLAVCFIPIIITSFPLFGRSSFDTFDLTFPLLFTVFLVCMVGVLFGTMASQSKKFQEFQLVLDKDTNKMNMYTPNPYLRYRRQANYYARLGHYLTAAWDLDKMQFRLIAPGERAGPGMGLLRKIFKNYWLVMYGDTSWLRSSILFASQNAELAESLMRAIDDFLRDGTGFTDHYGDGLLSERPYFP